MTRWQVGLVALLLAGCGAHDPAERTPDPDATVSAELTQYRRDEALHQVQVKVTNHGARPVVVDALDLQAPGFEAAKTRSPDARLDPGRRVDLPIVYGAARCTDGGPADETGAAVVRLWIDGSTEPVELPADDPAGLLPRLATEECAQRAVTDAVPLAFGDWARAGSGPTLVVEGMLRVGPVARAATLDRVDGTTLFRIDVGRLPVRLGEPVDVPVTLSPQRCDGHALADSKRGHSFRVGVSLDGAEPVLVTVEVDPEQRPMLEAAWLERCGL